MVKIKLNDGCIIIGRADKKWLSATGEMLPLGRYCIGNVFYDGKVIVGVTHYTWKSREGKLVLWQTISLVFATVIMILIGYIVVRGIF